MNSANLIEELNQALPDQRVLEDLSRIIREEARDGEIRIETHEMDSRIVLVPVSAPLEIIFKAFIKAYYNKCFGEYQYAVRIAIGGIRMNRDGTPGAGYLFTTLHYTADGEFVDIDFHVEDLGEVL